VDDERKAGIIRGIFAFCMICGAIAAALFTDVSKLPGLDAKRPAEEDDSGVLRVTGDNIGEILNQKDCVIVLLAHKRGNQDSGRTRKILGELERERYSGLVRMAQFDVEEEPEIAEREGVTPDTAPQLSFYADGKRLGEYRGPWWKEPIQRKIDIILHGYMQRIGKDWLPPVPGMKPEDNELPIRIIPPENPKQTKKKAK